MSLYLGNNLVSGVATPTEPTRNLGQIIESLVPLTDAGLHLLDGSLILGDGIYQGFVDYIAELYDNTPISGYKSNVTKVGSLADNNGVLSGFSLNNYAQIQMPNFNNASSFSLVLKIKLNSIPSDNVNFFASSASNQVFTGSITSSGKVGMAIGTGSAWSITETTAVGTTTLQTNADYWIKIEFTGSAYILSLSIDGETWNTEYTYTSSAKLPYSSSYNFNIGRNRNTSTSSGTYISGSIDLKGSYIDIDNSRWWTGAEAIKPIFCTEEQWQQSVTTYGVCGKFVYDSTNNTVRLPKVTGILEGTTDVSALGDLVEAGLPNITGNISSVAYTTQANGALIIDSLGTYNQSGSSASLKGATVIKLDASNSNSIYGNSTTVQPQTIKAFYYIVIATTTKTEIEVDIDEVATDLNGKADTDLSNVNNTGTSKGANWAMPSGTYTDLTLGASGTTYTAPANGWVQFVRKTNNGYTKLAVVHSGVLGVESFYGDDRNNVLHCHCLPVSKNDTFTVIFTGTLVSDNENRLQFIYAQGSESEAN